MVAGWADMEPHVVGSPAEAGPSHGTRAAAQSWVHGFTAAEPCVQDRWTKGRPRKNDEMMRCIKMLKPDACEKTLFEKTLAV